MSISHITFFIAAVICSLASAQSNISDCPTIRSIESVANATGNYSTPGLIVTSDGQFNESSEQGDQWTVHQFITREATTRVTLQESFITVPQIRNTGSSNSSAVASFCERHIFVPDKLTSRAPVDDSTCGVLISSACVRELKYQFQQNATRWAREQGASGEQCMDYIGRRLNSSTVPSACDFRVSASEIFDKSIQGSQQLQPTASNATDQCPKPLFRYFWDTRNSSETVYRNAEARAPKKADDYRLYDEAARAITLYLFARVHNGTDGAFADLQIMCARTEDIAAGSRRPSSSEASPRQGATASLALVGLLMVLQVL